MVIKFGRLVNDFRTHTRIIRIGSLVVHGLGPPCQHVSPAKRGTLECFGGITSSGSGTVCSRLQLKMTGSIPVVESLHIFSTELFFKGC